MDRIVATLAVAPVVEVANLSIIEGDSGISIAQFTFNLDTPTTEDIVFNYRTEDIDAVAESDYNAIAGQVIIPPGETTATVEVEVIGDRIEEENESFALQISDLSGATFNNIVLIKRRSQYQANHARALVQLYAI